MRLRALLFTTAALVSCGSSSSTECTLISVGPVPTEITITDDAGKPICDAYVTGEPPGMSPLPSFCTWTDCVCVHNVPIFTNIPSNDQPAELEIIVSRRGFARAIERATLPPPEEVGACPHPLARKYTVVLHALTDDPGASCVPRDIAICTDHRTCYDGATVPGCTPTAETSTDPGASYACCTP